MPTSAAINLEKYLSRINYKGEPKPDLSTLNELHKLHLLHIPFENLDIHYGRKISLEIEAIENKIVNENRGGFCYEMNALFCTALSQIGFDVSMISACVYESNGTFGKEFDHLALLVKLNETYLADVGFGANFIHPLKFILNEEQEDESGIYKINSLNENEFLLLFKSGEKDFLPQYKFTIVARKLEEFEEMCEYHQLSSESHFTQNKICTKLTENGRITLSKDKFIITSNGIKQITHVASEEEFRKILLNQFGMEVL